MTTLSAENIVVRRGGRTILDSVSLRANSGELIAVIGPNGAGKSTLFSVLAGLLKPNEGAVSVDGVALSRMKGLELARRRGFLPQNPRCEWPISVERLVALGLTPILPAFGGWSQGDQARIDRALESFDLADRRNQSAMTLSGGELARAMLARTFVGDPQILIVDEPITGLDPRHAIDSMNRLQAFAQSGKLVIVSLHDLTLAGRFATRIVALRDGRLKRDGTPAAALTPASIAELFDVSSTVTTGPSGLYVDFKSGAQSSGTGSLFTNETWHTEGLVTSARAAGFWF